MSDIPGTLQQFGNVREVFRVANARGLKLNDLAVLFALLADHPNPVRMARLLDQTSLARQTAHHHIRCLCDHVRVEQQPALVGKKRQRTIAHYGLTPEGITLCMQLLKRLSAKDSVFPE